MLKGQNKIKVKLPCLELKCLMISLFYSNLPVGGGETSDPTNTLDLYLYQVIPVIPVSI